MEEKEYFDKNKLDEIKIEIVRSADMSEKVQDLSFGLNEIISNLITKVSTKTGKPTFLSVSILSDPNPENKFDSLIFKQNFCIVPLGYSFQDNIPATLAEFKSFQQDYDDFLRNYPNEKREAKQKLIDCREIIQNIYDRILIRFNDPNPSLTEGIHYSLSHVENTFKQYAPEDYQYAMTLANLVYSLGNSEMQKFITQGSPKLAISKFNKIPVAQANRMLDAYSNRIMKTLISLLAKTWRQHEINYSEFDNNALKILRNLNLVHMQRDYKNMFEEFILDPNNLQNQANIDFMNICAWAGKQYAFVPMPANGDNNGSQPNNQ